MAIRSQTLDDNSAVNILIANMLLRTNTVKVGIIAKINGDNTINVQPAIQQIVKNTDLTTEYANLPVIKNVPVCVPFAPTIGMAITIPFAVGDNCVLLINDRSIDNWQTKGGVQPPVEDTEPRHHDLTDALALIGVITAAKNIANYSNTAIEIRNLANTVAVSVNESGITLKGNVTVTGTLSVAGATTAPTFNGVALTAGGSLVDFLNEFGTYTVP